MKLSVMITFCNQKDFIKDALDSCIKQKVNFDYEILIGLDYGDFESRKIIGNYIEKYSNIKLFEIDNSKLDVTGIEKASNNRLNLLKNAKGKYVCFLDGDDFYIDENRHQIMVDFLDNNLQYIACFHDYVEYDNQLKTYLKVEPIAHSRHEYNAKNYIGKHKQYSCFMYRNLFKEEIPKDFMPDIVDDCMFTHYFLRHGKFYFLPREMFAYRINVKSIFFDKEEIVQFLYMLLCAELTIQQLPKFKKQCCKKIRTPLKHCFRNINKIQNINSDELKQINNFAKRFNCYYTISLINWHKLNIVSKIFFIIRKNFCVFFKISI